MGRVCAILEFSLEHVSYSVAYVDMAVKLLGFHAVLPWRRERWDNGGKFCRGGSWEHTNRRRVEVPKAPVCSVSPCQPRILANEHKSCLTYRMMRRKNHKVFHGATSFLEVFLQARAELGYHDTKLEA